MESTNSVSRYLWRQLDVREVLVQLWTIPPQQPIELIDAQLESWNAFGPETHHAELALALDKEQQEFEAAALDLEAILVIERDFLLRGYTGLHQRACDEVHALAIAHTGIGSARNGQEDAHEHGTSCVALLKERNLLIGAHDVAHHLSLHTGAKSCD